MTCRAAARDRAREAAAAIRAHEHVAGVAVLPPEQDRTGRWAIEIDLTTGAGGLPHDIAGVAHRHRLTTYRICSQGPFWGAVLVA
jgi:hypothetical protein